MKSKKFLLPVILVAITFIAYIAATFIFCYTTKPEVTESEFPFSITYEYKGEIQTLAGVMKCKFGGSSTVLGMHSRFWYSEAIYENVKEDVDPNIIDSDPERQLTFGLHPNMDPGYFMGDPLESDHYIEYGLEGPYPFVDYYDYTNGIMIESEYREEVLAPLGIKIIDCSYPQPIENSFSFSGIKFEADNITIFLAITFLFLLLSLIFVRKDKEYTYSTLDKFGIALGFVIGFIAIPFIYSMCMFLSLAESGVAIVDYIIYSFAPFATFCLALSVIFRRKGFSKTGFFAQLVGILPFVIFFVLALFIETY